MDFGFSSIKEVDSVKGEACITQTGLNCCQETLDMVVTAIYSRAIAINAGNLVEILRAADYLQVSLFVWNQPPHWHDMCIIVHKA